MTGTGPKYTVDITSPVPIYHQIFTSLRNRVMEHEWQLNEAIPSEAELSEEYGVSRVTLRQALAKLEQDGILNKIRGKGNFIKSIPQPVIHDFNLPSALWRGAERKGVNFDAEVIESFISKPIPHINVALGLLPEQELAYYKRLFLQNGRPIAINRSWIANDLVPDIISQGLINNHLSTTLSARYDLRPVRIENILEASRPTIQDVQLLGVIYDTPIIGVSSLSYLSESQPLEYSITSWVGGRVKFHFDMDISP